MTKYNNSTTANDDGTLRAVRLDELKEGTFFMRKPKAKDVYVRGGYIPMLKKYLCEKYDGIGELCLRGSTIVYIGFEY